MDRRTISIRYRDGTHNGAALIEFAIVAVMLLGVLLPGVVSIGKAVSELTAASQAAYLGTRLGAEERIDLAPDSPDAHVAAVRSRISDVVHGRVVQTMDPMSRTAEEPDSDVNLFSRADDPSHWMVSTELEARFPLVLTSTPIRVRAVSSALNLQPETTQDLTTPQRLRPAGQNTFTSYTCRPLRCTGGAGCNPTCCAGDSAGLGLRFCGTQPKFGGGDFNAGDDIVVDDGGG